METTGKENGNNKKISRRVNVRTPAVMSDVHTEVEQHYRSCIVEKLRESGGKFTLGNTTIILAKKFGFCYGVERAIDLAYATRRVFPEKRIFLIGEIIHNPEVNRQLQEMQIMNLAGSSPDAHITDLTENDIVIVPAFGTGISMMDEIERRGCEVVDTTCGDVMRVWKRVRSYAEQGFTAIIHGKADHEETQATASRASEDGKGHYLVILTKEDCEFVCNYIRKGGKSEKFFDRFRDAHSPGFDPVLHLKKIGVANQTTMLKGETEEIQRSLYSAIKARDGSCAKDHFQFFDTICGATQERQDALYDMLKIQMDILLIVGGYNSSNTTHLVEIGQTKLPSFFIRDATCLESFEEIVHFDLDNKIEKRSYSGEIFDSQKPLTVGITAGASCPNNLIEETILRIFKIRGHEKNELLFG